MKTICVFLLLLFTSYNLSAQSRTVELEKIIEKQEADWNKNDMKAFADAFSDNAILINYLGFYWQTRDTIEEQFSIINDCCIKPTWVKFELIDANFLDKNVAIVYIKETLTAKEDYQLPGATIKKGSIDYKWVTAVFEKKTDVWKIVSMQVTQINQLVNE